MKNNKPWERIKKTDAANMYLNGSTDREIGEHFEVDRTAVVHFRKQSNIETKEMTGLVGVSCAESKLKSLGFSVVNMRMIYPFHEYDLLVDDKIKIEVMTSKITKDKNFKYALSSQEKKRLIESDVKIMLKGNRIKKLYRLTCDYIIAVGIGAVNHYWVIPSNDIPDEMFTLSLTPNSYRSKYNVYYEAWNLLKRM